MTPGLRQILFGSSPPLFRLDAANGIYPGGETFTRASDGWYTTSAGLVATAASGIKRTAHYVLGKPTLLLEAAKTNLCLRSAEFDNASWVKSATTVAADDIASPDGTTTADKVLETVANAQHIAYQSVTLAAGSHTFSVYLKALGRDWIKLVAHPASPSGVWFDITNGTVGTQDSGYVGSIQALSSGWYRCSMVFTGTVASWYFEIVTSASDGGSLSFVGDTSKGFYAWGAQIELGAFVSSYIVTTTAAATRAADALSYGATWSGQETTLYERYRRLSDDTWQEGVTVGTTTGPAAPTVDRAHRDFIYAKGNRPLSYFQGKVAA